MLYCNQVAEIPSYAVLGTPLIMASHAKRWSSETGPIETRNGAGFCDCDCSSWRSRLVDGGVSERSFDAMGIDLDKPGRQPNQCVSGRDVEVVEDDG